MVDAYLPLKVVEGLLAVEDDGNATPWLGDRRASVIKGENEKFGSCSFEEPVEYLTDLGLLAPGGDSK